MYDPHTKNTSAYIVTKELKEQERNNNGSGMELVRNHHGIKSAP